MTAPTSLSFLDIGTTYKEHKRYTCIHLVNIAQELATDVLTTRLLVVEDTG